MSGFKITRFFKGILPGIFLSLFALGCGTGHQDNSASEGDYVSGVIVHPYSVLLPPEGTLALTPTVLGGGSLQDKKVGWSALLGSVDDTGHYTAPRIGGVDWITATSHRDPSKSFTVSITVSNDPEAKGSFLPSGSLPETISTPQGVLLPDDRVLVIGGAFRPGTGDTGSAFYDPASSRWSQGPSLHHLRYAHQTTPLDGGRILITGGVDSNSKTLVSEAEFFDPVEGRFLDGPSLLYPRSGHIAIHAQDGRVLLVGGLDASSAFVKQCEWYDPVAAHFTQGPILGWARDGITATLLQDGRIFLAGGQEPDGSFPIATTLLDPATGTLTPGPNLIVGRMGHTATTLHGGKVLLAGGIVRVHRDGTPSEATTTMEILDPHQGTLTQAGNLGMARGNHLAFVLSDGRVLFSGGHNLGSYVGTSELFDPETRGMSRAGGLRHLRDFPWGTHLPGGGVLWVGCEGEEGTTVLRETERYVE